MYENSAMTIINLRKMVEIDVRIYVPELFKI